jgi:hypothetical protein
MPEIAGSGVGCIFEEREENENKDNFCFVILYLIRIELDKKCR